ncbi:MAG: hypothetical protein ACKV2V_22290 [Blastocatellia bacterium]
MANTIMAGMILLAAGTVLPPSIQEVGQAARPEAGQIASAPFMPGWNRVGNFDGAGLDRLIGKAGWNFFYIAEAMEKIAYGADPERATDKALRRIVTSLREKNFNCLEITRVTAGRYAGFPYVSVSAHSRHIQKSRVLFTDDRVIQVNASDAS